MPVEAPLDSTALENEVLDLLLSRIGKGSLAFRTPSVSNRLPNATVKVACSVVIVPGRMKECSGNAPSQSRNAQHREAPGITVKGLITLKLARLVGMSMVGAGMVGAGIYSAGGVGVGTGLVGAGVAGVVEADWCSQPSTCFGSIATRYSISTQVSLHLDSLRSHGSFSPACQTTAAPCLSHEARNLPSGLQAVANS